MPITTATKKDTNQVVLDKGNPNQVADVIQRMKLGTMVTPLKRTFTGLTSATNFDLTLIDGTGETTGVANPNRLAAGSVKSLRVTAGAAQPGARVIIDAAGTPAASATGLGGAPGGTASLSDDGKTVTFEAAVTAFIISYEPRPSVDMLAAFEKLS